LGPVHGRLRATASGQHHFLRAQEFFCLGKSSLGSFFERLRSRYSGSGSLHPNLKLCLASGVRDGGLWAYESRDHIALSHRVTGFQGGAHKGTGYGGEHLMAVSDTGAPILLNCDLKGPANGEAEVDGDWLGANGEDQGYQGPQSEQAPEGAAKPGWRLAPVLSLRSVGWGLNTAHRHLPGCMADFITPGS